MFASAIYMTSQRYLAFKSVSTLAVLTLLVACNGDSNTVFGSIEATTGASNTSASSEQAQSESQNQSQNQTETHTTNTSDSSIPVAGSTTASANNTPLVTAPDDAQVLLNTGYTLNGSVKFQGMPQAIPVIAWQKTSGPGQANFTDSSASTTSVSFDQIGTYVLTLIAENGAHSAQDSMTISVYAEAVNQAPIVNAGADESLTIDSTLTVSATASDDGLPNGLLTYVWSQVSGPGNATFGSTDLASTSVTFSATGTYELSVTASDGELNSVDSLQIAVSNAVVTDNNINNINADNSWQAVVTANGSKPQARHEAGGVAFDNKFYLMGGRGSRQVNRYSELNNSWENLGTPSMEMSHFQPVVYDGKIYVVGALDCCFPSENVISHVQVFDPVSKTWTQGSEFPSNRRRGSAGTVVYNNKIYIVGGSTNGHDGGMVNWFDEYNPATGQWKVLPDAPTQRDHFSAVMVGSKLVAAGGRQTDHPATFQNLVSAVDVYDFQTGTWTNAPAIPTNRAGAVVVAHGSEAIVIGGETDTGSAALANVEAYNVNTNSWRSLNPINTARHSGGAAIISDAIHIVSGNLTTGGGNETTSHEKIDLN